MNERTGPTGDCIHHYSTAKSYKDTCSSSVPLPSPLLTGPPVAALSINCMLFAALTIQIYSYEVKFPRDPLPLKIFVWFIYLMDAAQLILLHMFCWDIWVTGVGIQGGAPTPQADAAVHTMMTGIVATMIQGFFAWRIYTLRSNSIIVKIVAAIIVLLALMQCINCIAGVSSFLAAGKEAASVALEIKLAIFTQIWLISSVVCDLIIAVAMTWILVIYSNASSIGRTQSLVKSLILRSVETGTVTFVCTLANLILFWMMPENYIYMVFDRTLSKLYSNALFLSLNARQNGAQVSSTNWNSTRETTHGSFGLAVVSPNRAPLRFTSDADTIHIARHTVTDTETQFESRLSNKETFGSDV